MSLSKSRAKSITALANNKSQNWQQIDARELSQSATIFKSKKGVDVLKKFLSSSELQFGVMRLSKDSQWGLMVLKIA